MLEASDSRVVGAVAFRRTDAFREQHVAEFSFRVGRARTSTVRPTWTPPLRSGSQLALTVAAEDDEQRALAVSAGFTEGARWSRRLRSGGGLIDLLIMLRDVAPVAAPGKSREAFYGERKPWHAERVAGRGIGCTWALGHLGRSSAMAAPNRPSWDCGHPVRLPADSGLPDCSQLELSGTLTASPYHPPRPIVSRGP